LLSVIERIERAHSKEVAVSVFEQAVADFGAEYVGIHFLPRPKEDFEEVSIAWSVPEDWRAVYVGENLCHADPALRFARRTTMPFDWASAPFDPEAEPHRKYVVDRARDFNMHKALTIPIPGPTGMIGIVGLAGPHFEEREMHAPTLHVLALHAFHRLEDLVSVRDRKKVVLSHREREVLTWAGEGKTAWEIGCILSISQRTVEGYLAQACHKLGASNRTQAIAIFGAMHARSVQPSL
jgi:LuxR family quorum sensing-dependent transcriptional regulator